jgi:hypothetical protein
MANGVGKLQCGGYMAPLRGEVDREDSSKFGFKNSPRKLREFHNANPVILGLPVRLEE